MKRKIALTLMLALSLGLGAGKDPAFTEQQTQPAEPLRPDWCRQLPRPAYHSLERIPVSQEWYEVYQVRPNVFAIYEPRQYEEVISYLIVGSKQALLFDTGMGIGQIHQVVEELTALPVLVLNSHTHPDHVGGNAEFREVWAADTVFTRSNTGGYAEPEIRKWVEPDRLCGALPSGFDPVTYAIRQFHISHFVKDEESIDLGNREIEILLTPGHTPDSLCLLDRTNRLLFTGDTFYPGPIYLYSPESDFNAYAKSVSRLEKLMKQIDLLLPAHNVPVASPDFLSRLTAAVNQVRSGTVPPRSREGIHEYSFDGFSLLLPAAYQPAQQITPHQPKRDPFSEMRGDRLSSTPPTEALHISYVVVVGITKKGNEYIALLRGADGKVYFLKTGDLLYDGKIKKIDAESVTFLQIAGFEQREVRKKLHPFPE